MRKLINRIVAKYKGIPIGIIVYKPQTGWNKNIYWISLLTDDYIDSRIKEIAEHFRSKYQEEIKRKWEEKT